MDKRDPGSLEEWETVVADDFSLYYDAYSVDERVDSDSKVRGASHVRMHSQSPLAPCVTLLSLSSEHPLIHCPILR